MLELLPAVVRRKMKAAELMVAVLPVLLAASVSETAKAQISITLSPSGGTYTSSALSVTITWCAASSTLDKFSRVITLNGVGQPIGNWSTASIGGCQSAARTTISINLAVGNNVLEASINDTDGNPGYGFATYQRVQSQAPPVISQTPHNGTLREVARCVADCFENVLTYSTPSYVSMDVPRSVTLMYRSGQARPLGTIQLDVTDNSGTAADSFRLQLKFPSGAYVTFTNGQQAVYFKGGVLNGTTRIAAQFDAGTWSIPTSANVYTAIVTSLWTGGVSQSASASVRIIVLNELQSEYGAGWRIAGLKKLHFQSDGILVTDGAGSAAFFAGTCPSGLNCTFTSPAGDFSLFQQTGYTYKRTYPDGGTVTFNSDGTQATVADRFLNTTTYSYSSGKLLSIQDPAGKTTTFLYSNGSDGWKVGTLRNICTPSSVSARCTWMGINVNNHLVDLLEPDNIYFGFFQYDGTSRLTQFTDRRGGLWNYTYHGDGTLDTRKMPSVNVNNSSVRPINRYFGNATRLFEAVKSSGNGPAVARNVDLRAAVYSPRGYATYYSLNRWGAATQTDFPIGPSAMAIYDATTGQLRQTDAPSGHRVLYDWSGSRLTRVKDVTTGDSVRTDYTWYDQPTHVWGTVVEQWFTYDAGRLGVPMTSSKYGTHSKTYYSIDSRGRVTRVTDPGGHVTRTVYQSSGFQNTDSVVTPSIWTALAYDEYGRTRSHTYPHWLKDSTYYDLLNRVTVQVDGFRRRVTTGYDSLYVRTVTDAKGQVYRFGRNALGAATWELRPGSDTIRATYDSSGNTVTLTNRRGHVISFTYDALERPLSRNAAGSLTQYGYQSGGLCCGATSLAWASNAEARDTTWYDSADRPYRSRRYFGTTWYEFTKKFTSHGLDSILVVKSNAWASGDSVVRSFGYNTNHELTGFDAFGSHTSLWVNGEGQRLSMTYPNGLVQTLGYTGLHDQTGPGFGVAAVNAALGIHIGRDSLGRITERRRAVGDSLHLFDYDFGGRGELRQRIDYGGGTAPTCSEDSYFGWTCTSEPVIGSQSFQYDSVLTLVNGVTKLDPGNRIRVINGCNLSYDADGNLAKKSGTNCGITLDTLEWDALGQLTRVVAAGVEVTYGYDVGGMRVRRASGGVTTRFLYAGADLLAELDGSGGRSTEYAYLPGVDEPHSMKKGGQVYYFAIDPAGGSVRGLINASNNAVVATYGFSPYGKLEVGSFDNVTNPLRFAAREIDFVTGLYYFRARFLDPTTGSFISEDPLGIEGGINLYSYTAGDPVNRSDPSGLLGTAYLEGMTITEQWTNPDKWCWMREIYGDGCGGSSAAREPERGGGSARQRQDNPLQAAVEEMRRKKEARPPFWSCMKGKAFEQAASVATLSGIMWAGVRGWVVGGSPLLQRVGTAALVETGVVAVQAVGRRAIVQGTLEVVAAAFGSSVVAAPIAVTAVVSLTYWVGANALSCASQ